MSEKQYGLILPKKNKSSPWSCLGSRIINPLLGSDDELEKDDDNEETALNWIENSLKDLTLDQSIWMLGQNRMMYRTLPYRMDEGDNPRIIRLANQKSAGNAGQRSMQKRMLKEAIKEDATVFQYDEVYDDMKASAETKEAEKKNLIQRKPKYINTILKQAEKRKLENERRQERKVQKERDAEGDQFIDKEAFVTSSYLKKLEEIKQAEEEERIERLFEENVDVHKHKNFGVFYNHIFKQRMGDNLEAKEESSSEVAEIASTENFKTANVTKKKNYRTQRDLTESPDRIHRQSEKHSADASNISSGEDNHEESSLRISFRNTSYKSKDKSKRDGNKKRSSRERSTERKKALTSREDAVNPIKDKGSSDSSKIGNSSTSVKEEKVDEPAIPIVDVKLMDIEERIVRYQNIYSKRTVGVAFKDAIQRYLQRKSIRETG